MKPCCTATLVAALCLCNGGLAETGPYADVVLADNPIGYWQFEDGDVTLSGGGQIASIGVSEPATAIMLTSFGLGLLTSAGRRRRQTR